jgi:ribonuclease VapC
VIAVDTSALMAIVLGEPGSGALMDRLAMEDDVVISAATLAETLIIAARRNVGETMTNLIDEMAFEVMPVTASVARRVSEVYARWGKGLHPAGLNFCDCFAYDAARSKGCPLLFVGNDFTRTDVNDAG